jgi:hypothetical protein
MDRFIRRLLLSLLLLSATHVYAESSFVVSPLVGSASISNITSYNNSPYLRVDGSFHPIPQFGINLFVAGYSGFRSSGGGNDVTIKLNGAGAGVTGRWPVHPHVQPYVRLDYMLWNAESTGLGRTLAKDKGGSAGLAVGAQFPIKSIYGVKAEVSGYNNVSGADIRQFSLGLALEF